MLIFDKVDSYWYEPNNPSFIGCVPVLDPEYGACEYYSCENVHPEKEYDRIVPCYHHKVDSEWMTDIEKWYFEQTLNDNIRPDSDTRNHFIHRFYTLKYIVRFIGCDNGDKLLRFVDKEHALEYLNSVSSFEEIYDNEFLMEY